MEHLDDVAVEELQQALDEVDGKKPTKRLVAAIAYKNGISQTELADWYGVGRRTIYGWLKRFEDRPLAAAATDASRPGRPRKLTGDQQNELETMLQEPPVEHGRDATAWTPGLLQQVVEDRFGVTYSQSSCRRLLKEAGVR
jgi:transposase